MISMWTSSPFIPVYQLCRLISSSLKMKNYFLNSSPNSFHFRKKVGKKNLIEYWIPLKIHISLWLSVTGMETILLWKFTKYWEKPWPSMDSVKDFFMSTVSMIFTTTRKKPRRKSLSSSNQHLSINLYKEWSSQSTLPLQLTWTMLSQSRRSAKTSR